MNVIILHHFSDYWSHGMSNNGTTYENELEKVLDFIKNTDIDKVILPLFEKHELEECHSQLESVCRSEGIEIDVHEYNYAWSKESDPDGTIYTEENFNKTWCQGTRDRHGDDDVIEITEWMHDLKNSNKIYVAGAFESKCVLDLETALDAIDLEYEKVDALVVGTGVNYEFIGKTRSDIIEEVQERITEIENKIESYIEEHELDGIYDLDDLYDEAPLFTRKIEGELNQIYNDFEDENEDFELIAGYDVNYTDDQMNERFGDYSEINDFSERDFPDKALGKILENIVEKIEDNYIDTLYNYDTFDELIENDKDAAKDFYSELKNKIEELNEEIKTELQNIDVTLHTRHEITDEILEKIVDGEEINIDIKAILMKKEKITELKGTYYHGTLWQLTDKENIKEDCFTSLSGNESNYGDAVYITNGEDTAEWFSGWKKDNSSEDIELQVVFKVEVDIDNVYNFPFEKHYGVNTFKFQGIEYNFSEDREEYFQEIALKHNGVCIEGNYENGLAHDIAIFDDSLLQNVTAVKLKINDNWSDYMSIKDAKKLVEKQFFKQKKKMKLS